MVRKVLLVIAIVLIAGLITAWGFGLFGGEQSSPEKVVDAFMKAFQDKDFSKAISLTIEPRELSDEELEMWDKLFEDVEILDYEVGEIIEDSDKVVRVKVTATTLEGGRESVSSIYYRVVNIDGKWHVDHTSATDDDPAMDDDGFRDFDDIDMNDGSEDPEDDAWDDDAWDDFDDADWDDDGEE